MTMTMPLNKWRNSYRFRYAYSVRVRDDGKCLWVKNIGGVWCYRIDPVGGGWLELADATTLEEAQGAAMMIWRMQ